MPLAKPRGICCLTGDISNLTKHLTVEEKTLYCDYLCGSVWEAVLHSEMSFGVFAPRSLHLPKNFKAIYKDMSYLARYYKKYPFFVCVCFQLLCGTSSSKNPWRDISEKIFNFFIGISMNVWFNKYILYTFNSRNFTFHLQTAEIELLF